MHNNIAKPTAEIYTSITPQFIEHGVTNFFRNLAEVILYRFDDRIINKYGYCSGKSVKIKLDVFFKNINLVEKIRIIMLFNPTREHLMHGKKINLKKK